MKFIKTIEIKKKILDIYICCDSLNDFIYQSYSLIIFLERRKTINIHERIGLITFIGGLYNLHDVKTIKGLKE